MPARRGIMQTGIFRGQPQRRAEEVGVLQVKWPRGQPPALTWPDLAEGDQLATISEAPRGAGWPVLTPASARQTPSVHWGGYAIAFWALALVTLGAKFASSFVFDLNLMESYGVIMARHPSLSFPDHPPLTWWLISLVTHAFGSEAAPLVRAPFMLLFLGTSWLLYRMTECLFDARAAFYAAGMLTLAPLFGLWVGALALTDGLTIFFALAAVFCLIRIFFEPEEDRLHLWRLWLGAGMFFGLALASKYTAILLLPGLLLFLISSGPERSRWLLRPHPYLAMAASLIPLLPVLIWNAEHGWISFLYQGGRAGFDESLHPMRMLRWILAQSLYLQPWIFIALIAELWRGLNAGPASEKGWFCVCLALTPLVFFPGVMLWSSQPLRGYHWAAIGYVMLFPLIGAALDRLAAERPQTAKRWITAAAVTFAAALVFLVSHAMTGWGGAALGRIDPAPFRQADPILTELFDWADLPKALRDRHIDPAHHFITGPRWEACAKAGYVLKTPYRMLCLAPDSVHFADLADPATFRGHATDGGGESCP